MDRETLQRGASRTKSSHLVDEEEYKHGFNKVFRILCTAKSGTSEGDKAMKDPQFSIYFKSLFAVYKPDRYIIDPVESWDAYDVIFVKNDKKVFKIRVNGLDYEATWRKVLKTKLGEPSFFGNIPFSLLEK